MNKLIKYFNEHYGTKKEKKYETYLNCKDFILLDKGFIIPYDATDLFTELSYHTNLYLKIIMNKVEKTFENINILYEDGTVSIVTVDKSFGFAGMLLTEENLDLLKDALSSMLSEESIEKIKNNIGGMLFIINEEFSSIELLKIYEEEIEKECIIKDCKPSAFIYDIDNYQINVFENIPFDILGKKIFFEITYIDKLGLIKRKIVNKIPNEEYVYYKNIKNLIYDFEDIIITISNAYNDTNNVRYNVTAIDIYDVDNIDYEIKSISIYKKIPSYYILKLEYPKTRMDFYRAYSFLKTVTPQLDDIELTKLLNEVEVPKPKNADELELYMDCVDKISEKERIIREFKNHEIVYFPKELAETFGEESMDCVYINLNIEDFNIKDLILRIEAREEGDDAKVEDFYEINNETIVYIIMNMPNLLYFKNTKKIYFIGVPYEFIIEENASVILKERKEIPLINPSVYYINEEKDNYETIKNAIDNGKTLLYKEEEIIRNISWSIDEEQKIIEMYFKGYMLMIANIDRIEIIPS